MSANSGVIKQVIRYTVTSSGNYTKSGLSIDPNKTLVLINGSGYTVYETRIYYSETSVSRNIDVTLVSVTSGTIVTQCSGSGISYSVQVIEFC